MENFGKFMTVVLVMVITPIINGFVFVKLWHWFIAPTFEMNELRIVEAIGIMILINFAFKKKPKDKKSDVVWAKFVKSIFHVIIIALFGLGLGYLVSLFM